MKLFKVKIYLNPLFLVVIILFSVTQLLAEGLILFFVVMFHEFGHIVVAKILGYDIEKVEILPVGGVAVINQPLEFNSRDEWFIALAGPFNNLIMIFICFIFKSHLNYFTVILNANLILFLFNLLPAFPLDGGRVLRAYLSNKTSLSQANKFAVLMGFFCGILLLGISIYSFFYANEYSVYLLVLSSFIIIASRKEYTRATYSSFNLSFQKKACPKRGEVSSSKVIMAHYDSLVYKVAKELNSTNTSLVIVIDDNGQIVDLITEYLVIEAVNRGMGNLTIKKLVF
ncbi:M50 family metallopeptidase [Proteinivorax tanatarense]|uniref:M50 family metallopeptidase n=1 Tax=Proteinivorax tanatarense TaxID=1260629 RepID=A0AAU7VIK4_9FIRM